MSTAFTIPYPPSVNHYWRVFRNRVVLTEAASAYKWEVKAAGVLQSVPISKRKVSISLDVYRPRAIGDLDNVFKAVCDALKGVAYYDDAQIIQIHAFRYDDKKNPRVVVTVEECQ